MRRTDAAAAAAALVLAWGCAGGSHGAVREVQVGHHHVAFVLPRGWEHIDHGRVQLFRLGEAQLSLVDLGPVTAETMASDLDRARGLWLLGRRRDASEHVRELRSPALQYASREQQATFWRPWNDAVYAPVAADSAEIGTAFAALIRGTDAFAPPTPELLFQYVADHALDGHGQEIASRKRRTVMGRDWMVYDLWNRVSHDGHSSVAFNSDDGYLLALTMDRGVFEQLSPAFESLLASLEVSPEPSNRDVFPR